MKGCGNLCEAIAMYGAVMQARGDTEEAKVALLDLMALAPTFDLDRKRYLQTYLGLKAQVATGRGAQLRGSLTIVTKPAGARVYVNNTLAGYSPVTLNTVPVGKAMVRIERPGFKRVGDLVEISPEEQSMSYELTASSAWKAWDSLMNKLAGEASKDKGGATMTQVANSLKLERAVIGVLKTLDSGTMEFNAGYFDLKTGKRYSWRRSSFQEDEFGQLQGEVGRLVNRLLNEASQDKQALSKDPLKNTSGTEDWAAEDRGGKRDKRDKNSKGGDPLEGASGTEDW